MIGLVLLCVAVLVLAVVVGVLWCNDRATYGGRSEPPATVDGSKVEVSGSAKLADREQQARDEQQQLKAPMPKAPPREG